MIKMFKNILFLHCQVLFTADLRRFKEDAEKVWNLPYQAFNFERISAYPLLPEIYDGEGLVG